MGADAYTTSNEYPYSQRTVLEENGISKDEINYIRNSVKVIIDAYTGDVTFYRTDKTDPIARYMKKYIQIYSLKKRYQNKYQTICIPRIFV